MSEGPSDEAIQYFQRAILDKPFDTTAYYNLAVLYQERGQVNEALQTYRRLLRINPNDSDALANVAALYNDNQCCRG